MEKSNPTLREIQIWMREAVTHPDLTTERAESLIQEHPRGPTPRERIGVYSGGWFLRLNECLRDDYPSFSQNLGEQKWEELLGEFLRAQPSSSFNIGHVGQGLPGFFIERDSSAKSSYLSELALLERALYQTRGVPNYEIWNVTELQGLSIDEAETLRFRLAPGAQLLRFDWNVDGVKWDGAKPNREVTDLVVYRHKLSPTSENITSDEYRFLEYISRNPLLTDLITEFEGSSWMEWLARFAADGVLLRLK